MFQAEYTAKIIIKNATTEQTSTAVASAINTAVAALTGFHGGTPAQVVTVKVEPSSAQMR